MMEEITEESSDIDLGRHEIRGLHVRDYERRAQSQEPGEHLVVC